MAIEKLQSIGETEIGDQIAVAFGEFAGGLVARGVAQDDIGHAALVCVMSAALPSERRDEWIATLQACLIMLIDTPASGGN